MKIELTEGEAYFLHWTLRLLIEDEDESSRKATLQRLEEKVRIALVIPLPPNLADDQSVMTIKRKGGA